MTQFSKLLTFISLLVTMAFVFSSNSYGCSMVKLTKNGKTVVGNNEDQMNPNTRIWFENGKNGGYGVVYVGFDNLFPQGGMNEAGLVFDGFTQSFRVVTDTIGKLKCSSRDLPKKVMQECATVEEAKSLLNRYNRSFWSASVLRFVDKTGKYLYVDGDSLIIGEKAFFVQTNVRPYENKRCWRLEKATRLLENSFDASVGFCTSVMDSVHQATKWGGTIYTSVYDLNEGKIHLFYFYDFQHEVTFDLKEELKKGDRVLNMPELFPKCEFGQKYLSEYNKILSKIKQLGDSSTVDETASINAIESDITSSFIDSGPFYYKIYKYAEYYLTEEINYPRAILISRLYVQLCPDDWRGYDILGEAYAKNKQYQLALDNYLRSVELYPDNTSGKKQIEYLKKLIAR